MVKIMNEVNFDKFENDDLGERWEDEEDILDLITIESAYNEDILDWKFYNLDDVQVAIKTEERNFVGRHLRIETDSMNGWGWGVYDITKTSSGFHCRARGEYSSGESWEDNREIDGKTSLMRLANEALQ